MCGAESAEVATFDFVALCLVAVWLVGCGFVAFDLRLVALCLVALSLVACGFVVCGL